MRTRTVFFLRSQRTCNDGDGDGVNDAMDSNCPNTPANQTVDNFGCAQSELDDDNDGVTNDLDQCVNTMTTWNARPDGCAPEQTDTDADTVTDATDTCANTPAGEPANSAGCSLSQIDSDNDGQNDAEDAFPNDPTEWDDTDGDGVGDNADYYPTDRSRSVDEGGVSLPFWIALVIVVFVGIGATAVFLMRRTGSEEVQGAYEDSFIEPQPAQDIYEMASVDSTATIVSTGPTAPAHATINEHGQTSWVDETGISWCQDPDGSLRRYDTESGAWVSHQ